MKTKFKKKQLESIGYYFVRSVLPGEYIHLSPYDLGLTGFLFRLFGSPWGSISLVTT
jgi:hypothetical protein